ncbi:Acid-sensing ion channel 4 [Bagarius yarrelli]|uniref:Acid-sensing ion channel 4 n=1 Tax=Bagarius yarrelli TaxID=175774 RepID=A0A556V1G6_BAGYA|nr:Acid-sensing ion channel 4 [Bagarius yarrelli]
MPVELVCKIKLSEEETRRTRADGGERASLLEESCRAPAKDLAGFASSCSLHGMRHVFGVSASGGRGCTRRTVWAAALLASLALFLYQASQCAVSYLQRAHVTALREEAARELLFPAVTICNTNRFRFSALTDADIYHLANLTGLPPKNPEGHRAAELQYPEPDMQDIFNRTGHQLEDMLKSCNFSGHNCTARDFTVYGLESERNFNFEQFWSIEMQSCRTGSLKIGEKIKKKLCKSSKSWLKKQDFPSELASCYRIDVFLISTFQVACSCGRIMRCFSASRIDAISTLQCFELSNLLTMETPLGLKSFTSTLNTYLSSNFLLFY